MIEKKKITESKDEDLNKVAHSFELLKNQVMFVTIADGIENIDNVQKLYDKLEVLYNICNKKESFYLETDEEKAELWGDQLHSITKLQNMLYDFIKIFEKYNEYN